MAKGVSLREFARRMGVRISAVQKARDAGRITLNPDGTVDPVRGRRQWGENTIHSKRHRGRPRVKGTQTEPEPTPEGSREDREDTGGEGMSSGWHRAREVHETIKARLLQLELEKKQGKLLDADEVRRTTFALARRTRDRLLAMPSRLGPEVSGLSPDEATRVLREEVERICEELAGKPPSEDGEGEVEAAS